MEPQAKNVYRPAVGIVGGIADGLIVEADLNRGAKSVFVIGLDDLLRPVMGQFAIAYDDAQAAGVEIGRVGAGNAVDDAGIEAAPVIGGHKCDAGFIGSTSRLAQNSANQQENCAPGYGG